LYGKSVIAHYSHVQEALRGHKTPSGRAILDAIQSAQRHAVNGFRNQPADGD
jgi:hypothetical protein